MSHTAIESTGGTTGVIHDIGYRHYRGPRLGRGHAVGTLFVYSLRAVFGLGRSARSKVVPVLLLGVCCLPALLLVAITATGGQTLLPYPGYAYFLQVATIVFVAAQAPVLVVGDLRHRVLPLYFSRPLQRYEYVAAKLGALGCALFVVFGAPIVILYLGGLLAGADLVTQTGRFLPALAGAAGYAVVLAALGLALACLTRRRAFAILTISGVYLVTNAMVSAAKGVAGMTGAGWGPYVGVLTPYDLLDGFQSWAFGTQATAPSPPTGAQGALYGLVTAMVLAGSVGILLRRYWKVEQ